MLDFNKSVFRAKAASVSINEKIDAAVLERAGREPSREYLGASSVGQPCLRRIHWDWRHPNRPTEAKTHRVFWRGHTFEKYIADQFVLGGFTLHRGSPETGFEQAEGRFRGHCDGVFKAGPAVEGVGYPCLWEAKALGEKSFAQIERDGLQKAKPEYYGQVQLYMAYLGLTEHPAIFTIANVGNGELVHLLVEYDAVEAQRVSDRAVTVLKADAAGETLPRISDDPSFWLCRFCSHRPRCHGASS